MKRYNIHNVVDIIIHNDVSKSIIDATNFQIRHFEVDDKSIDKCKYSISIKSYSDYQPSGLGASSVFHNVVSDHNRVMIDSENELIIEKGNGSYTIYASYPNFLINVFIHNYFLKEGYSMVHAACVELNGKSFLLPGPGGVGKTALVGYAVKTLGMRVHGDDIVLIGKTGDCLAFPRSFVLKEYHRKVYPDVFKNYNIKQNKNYAFKRFLIENAPFLPIIKKILRKYKLQDKISQALGVEPYLATLSVEDILGEKSVAETSKIEKILFIERTTNSEFELIQVDSIDVINRMFSIIYHEWVESFRQILVLGSLGLLDVNKMFTESHKIIKANISEKECFLLKVPNNSPIESLYEQFSKFIK